METLKLKNSDLEVSRLCMGGCPMGRYGWGTVLKKELIDAVHLALDSGINFFDTADTYGLGESEKTLGEALGKKRKQAIVATKFGVRVENGITSYDNSKNWVNKAVNNSLKRLNTDYIDLYQIHYRDSNTSIEEVINTLEEIKKQGKIRYYGICNVHYKDINELNKYKGKFVSFQNEYSLACRKNENDMFEFSQNLEMSPLTWGSLGQGILTGKYDKNCTFDSDDRRNKEIYVNFHGKKLLKNLKIVDVLKEISKEVKRPISSIAIRFILDYIPKSVVLAGIKNTDQLKGNCEAFGWKLNEKQIQWL
ncbi:aldo/keto reductase [Eubacterium limosum]|nr:aldo/keto reductase [Eubacterium limosum]MCB6569659.1 aldo/keto reductase [Eubacterium limosum]